MSRSIFNVSGGVARRNVVDHGVFMKPVSLNPFLATTHDGVTTSYMGGFSPKKVHWLYRFRFNLLPQGMMTGFYSRNPYGRHVH